MVKIPVPKTTLNGYDNNHDNTIPIICITALIITLGLGFNFVNTNVDIIFPNTPPILEHKLNIVGLPLGMFNACIIVVLKKNPKLRCVCVCVYVYVFVFMYVCGWVGVKERNHRVRMDLKKKQ
jgi:hypothetical protein